MRKLVSRLYRFVLLKMLYPFCYHWYARKPVDPKKVLFIETRFPELTNSFSLVYSRLSEYQDWNLTVRFLRSGFVSRWEYIKRCLSAIRDYATARYVFFNDSSDAMSAFHVRKETTVVQLWHGCGAMKKCGYSVADLLFGETKKSLDRYPVNANYDYITVSSPDVAWVFEEAMGIRDGDSRQVVPTGVSRTDIYFDPAFRGAAQEKLYAVMPQAKGKRVILYAPTFRGHVATATSPDRLDAVAMAEHFAKDSVLLFKHHPLVKQRPAIAPDLAQFAMDVTDKMTIEELLCVADICISDYSSLVFEYSLLRRPMLFFAFDKDDYTDWRGFYYPYEELVPGPIVHSTDEIIREIEAIAQYDLTRIDAFREKFMRSCDGHATDRILAMTFGDALDTSNKSAAEQEVEKVAV